MNRFNKILLNNNLIKNIRLNYKPNSFIINKRFIFNNFNNFNENNNILNLYNNNNNIFIKKNYYSTTKTIEPNEEIKNKINNEVLRISEMISKDSNNLNNLQNYLVRATLYHFNGEFEKANQDFHKILELTNNEKSDDFKEIRNKVYHSLSFIQSQQGNYEKALEIIEKSFKENNITIATLSLKAECLFKMNRYLEAANFYNSAFKSLDKDSKDLEIRFLSYSFSQQLLECYNKLLTNNNDNDDDINIDKNIKSILNKEIPTSNLKQEEFKTFNQILDKSIEIVNLLNPILAKYLNGNEISKQEKDRLEHLYQYFLVSGSCTNEALRCINNENYKNQNRKIDNYILNSFKEISEKYF